MVLKIVGHAAPIKSLFTIPELLSPIQFIKIRLPNVLSKEFIVKKLLQNYTLEIEILLK